MKKFNPTTVLLLLTIWAFACFETARAQRPDDTTKIKATVIAYDLGVEQASGLCKQTIIAQREKLPRRSESDRYLIIQRYSPCPELLPEKSLTTNQQRTFTVRRDTKCDQTFDDLRYFLAVAPNGVRTKSRRLIPVEGWDESNAPATKRLPCYFLSPPDPFKDLVIGSVGIKTN